MDHVQEMALTVCFLRSSSVGPLQFRLCKVIDMHCIPQNYDAIVKIGVMKLKGVLYVIAQCYILPSLCCCIPLYSAQCTLRSVESSAVFECITICLQCYSPVYSVVCIVCITLYCVARTTLNATYCILLKCIPHSSIVDTVHSVLTTAINCT